LNVQGCRQKIQPDQDRIYTRAASGCYIQACRFAYQPIPLPTYPGQDDSVSEADQGAQPPYPARPQRSSPEAADVPEPRGVPEGHSKPAASESQTGPSPMADVGDDVASEVPKTHARLLPRLMILLGLALACVVAGVWAIVLFPSRAAITSPTPLELSVSEGSASSTIDLTISPSGTQSVKVAVKVVPLGAPVKVGQVTLGFDIFDGMSAVSCPSGVSCSPVPALGKFTFVQMTFNIQVSGNTNPGQEAFTVKNRRFSATSNGESAIAEMPAVLGGVGGSSVTPPELIVTYYVPNANTYDWSIPPDTVDGYSVSIPEQLSTTDTTEAVEITGTNHQAQTQDNQDTFIAGILLGVAGAAAVATVQEGLHMVFDNPDDSVRPKPSRPSTSN
jgi:hypothetical protein